MSSGKQINDPAIGSKIVWSSWTRFVLSTLTLSHPHTLTLSHPYSVLGEEVVGIWPKSADKGDVNTAHLSSSGTAIATGDDFGCVKLFNGFPLKEKFVSY